MKTSLYLEEMVTMSKKSQLKAFTRLRIALPIPRQAYLLLGITGNEEVLIA